MKKVVITGGGTGGHIYPALAIAEAIKGFSEIYYVGHPNKIEAVLVPKKGIYFYPIKSFILSKNPINFFKIGFSIIKSIYFLNKTSPALVIGVGGFISIPITVAAKILNIPLLIHEQNVHIGKANRLLLKLGASIAISFNETRHYIKGQKVYLTGCPVRGSIGTINREVAKEVLGIANNKKVIVVMGGSGGASCLNKIAKELIIKYSNTNEVKLIVITGKSYYNKFIEELSGVDIQHTLILDYSEKMEYILAAADLAISRSGSSTINELLCCGTPSILIPSPNVTENHQEINAKCLAKLNAAKVCLESNIESDFHIIFNSLINKKDELEIMKENCLKNCSGKIAGENIKNIVMSIISL